ncbi:hypothetical protein A6F55_23815 [Prescottella equi]|uniref:hypothetical protein n=1 Tax=Rhodococcus hoagii TaxID=43767 RepID=UPI000A0FAF41|nr:hypothetical protein [Prescottella equi]ORJ92593.1 hypothetical protein A6F55_23815 [Prescottella equi]
MSQDLVRERRRRREAAHQAGVKPRVGEWWTMDKRGEAVAHLVAVVKPDLLPRDKMPDSSLLYELSEWSPACVVSNVSAMRATWSATVFSTFKSDDEPPAHRCTVCESLVERLRERTADA